MASRGVAPDLRFRRAALEGRGRLEQLRAAGSRRTDPCGDIGRGDNGVRLKIHSASIDAGRDTTIAASGRATGGQWRIHTSIGRARILKRSGAKNVGLSPIKNRIAIAALRRDARASQRANPIGSGGGLDAVAVGIGLKRRIALGVNGLNEDRGRIVDGAIVIDASGRVDVERAHHHACMHGDGATRRSPKFSHGVGVRSGNTNGAPVTAARDIAIGLEHLALS